MVRFQVNPAASATAAVAKEGFLSGPSVTPLQSGPLLLPMPPLPPLLPWFAAAAPRCCAVLGPSPIRFEAVEVDDSRETPMKVIDHRNKYQPGQNGRRRRWEGGRQRLHVGGVRGCVYHARHLLLNRSTLLVQRATSACAAASLSPRVPNASALSRPCLRRGTTTATSSSSS